MCSCNNVSYSETIQIAANWATALGFILAIIVGIIALSDYKENKLVQRAEFYTRIFEMLFKDTTYLKIRERLDQYIFTEEYYASLEAELQDESNSLMAEMTNYLNYLEYVMVLEKINVIKDNDIINLLEYYLRKIKQNRTAMNFIEENGFENLRNKINSL